MHHKIQFEQSVLFIMVKVLQNSAALPLSCKTEVFSYCTSYWNFYEKTESDAHHHHPSLPLYPP